VWKCAALFLRGGDCVAAVISGGNGPVFRISDLWAVLVVSGALERRFKSVIARFLTQKAPA
jgi:hypothetical protein